MNKSLIFDKSISRQQSNQLLTITKRLKYRQIKLINLFIINQRYHYNMLKKEDYTNKGVSSYILISVL